jgi:hypothetical protein
MTLDAGFRPLQLPRREAPDMQAELVQQRDPIGARELDLEFQLVLRDGPLAHCALLASTRPAPGTVGVTQRHAPGPDGRVRVFSEERLVRNDSSFEEVGDDGDGGDYDPADDHQS